MEIFIIAAVIGLIPALIAQSKGRSFVGWYIYGFLLFIVALIHSLVVRDLKTQAATPQAMLASGQLRKCPQCAEAIQHEAKICRWCGATVEPQTPVSPFAHLPSYQKGSRNMSGASAPMSKSGRRFVFLACAGGILLALGLAIWAIESDVPSDQAAANDAAARSALAALSSASATPPSAATHKRRHHHAPA